MKMKEIEIMLRIGSANAIIMHVCERGMSTNIYQRKVAPKETEYQLFYLRFMRRDYLCVLVN